ncbi:class E basic helix-loop-helix protein 22-like, partial [Nannospalax galili]|uniref:class E basic helix-loop-helix protein 22-like n=1 Tax=Nannospalax galili TaxID=1026970 RepID=UPI000819E243
RGLHLGAAAAGEDDLFLHKSLSSSTAKRLEAAFRSTPPGMDLSLAPPPRERPASSSSSPLGCFEPADPEGAGLLLPPPGGGGGAGGGVSVPGLLVGSAGVGGAPSLGSLPAGAALCLKYGEGAGRGSVAESSGGEQSPDDDSDGRCELVL